MLFVPLPEPALPEEEAVEEEPPEEEEEAIDILSLSDIEAPEPPAEPPPEQPPQQPQEPAPQPAAVPPPPDPTQVPETPAETPTTPADDQPPVENDPGETPAGSFDPARQQTLLGQTGGINSEFDQTEYFPVYAWNPTGDNSPAYLSGWDTQRLNCFFTSIAEMEYTLAPGADRLKYLTRNFSLIVNEDLPKTFPGQQVVQEPNGYCGESFFTIAENGAPVGIYVSAIPVGEGSPPANIILVFWTTDPRQ